ncbi:MAG: hypothetical protein JKY65_15815 [Planctomycetes bacterium]|nr:hypothetical protein [Planctomycetota bacterium]
MSVVQPRVVVVTRPTELEALLARHGTRGQAEFFLASRGQSLAPLEERQRSFEEARTQILRAIPVRWRRTQLSRSQLDRFLFEPSDLVVVIGQDGLVPNVAKYLSGQLVIGVNPDPALYEGLLVPHSAEAGGDLLQVAHTGRALVEDRAMVEARLDDGQTLRALNELYLGHLTHQSSRYRISWRGAAEDHSSSGLIVATGTGASGWARSVRRNRVSPIELPEPGERRLAFFVREAWPSVATGTDLTDGEIQAEESLLVTSQFNQDGVIFGDGIEADRLEFGWGRQVEIGLAEECLRLVVG